MNSRYYKNLPQFNTQKRGGNHMEIAIAVLKFIGGVIPLVTELLKAVM
ncbi:hypothetical protein EMIT079MI2_70178 [Bacillus sp. IT-79MI2]